MKKRRRRAELTLKRRKIRIHHKRLRQYLPHSRKRRGGSLQHEVRKPRVFRRDGDPVSPTLPAPLSAGSLIEPRGRRPVRKPVRPFWSIVFWSKVREDILRDRTQAAFVRMRRPDWKCILDEESDQRPAAHLRCCRRTLMCKSGRGPLGNGSTARHGPPFAAISSQNLLLGHV